MLLKRDLSKDCINYCSLFFFFSELLRYLSQGIWSKFAVRILKELKKNK